MWPFRINKWSRKQKAHRRLCRQEEAEMERLINFFDERVKTAQEQKMTSVATTPSTTPNQDADGPFEGLGGASYSDAQEFEQNSDPKGDACCYEPRCPCHSNQQGE